VRNFVLLGGQGLRSRVLAFLFPGRPCEAAHFAAKWAGRIPRTVIWIYSNKRLACRFMMCCDASDMSKQCQDQVLLPIGEHRETCPGGKRSTVVRSHNCRGGESPSGPPREYVQGGECRHRAWVLVSGAHLAWSSPFACFISAPSRATVGAHWTEPPRTFLDFRLI
jgi:hypothetical protein